jgi:hypothetical protein
MEAHARTRSLGQGLYWRGAADDGRTGDYDHQEMYRLSEAARQAAAKAKRLEEHNHAHAAHAEAAAVK